MFVISNGDSFVWEINGVDSDIFEAYLDAFSQHKPEEVKILVSGNAGFHSTNHIEIPNNIRLFRIPPYSPELNPCEQVWSWIKSRFKNLNFESMDTLKEWLYETVLGMQEQTIKSIVSNHHFLTASNTAFSG